ncbi:alpha/beta hydrolase [Bdellovibrio svalbardensis]|uniref:Alpha/beta hydrolase-fold protein n=1 Tax=Bdellovibrio svalbardensis TaxID=2972972 RepID=A0ABT6DLM4_9BACT|nr:alpha/beta hydrolase-fold protein [Bdellovibrio svalbardensis]MDG0817412.1 alpha/beta hydrolase-fold protein [Bdellovibrio svalbardensis]
MISSETLQNLRGFEITNFNIETLKIDSAHLKHNPLKDSALRYNPLLVPKSEGPWPVVFILGGFSGNAPFYFNPKFNEQNAVQVIDQAFARGEAPEALYVFVDALSTWGGSQFLNSAAVGNYEDYIMQEIVPSIKKHFNVSHKASEWCVMGGSSGGYGALHLSSKYPEFFGVMAAIAPDSFFEASLLNDLYQALPLWEKYQSGIRALEELRSGKLTKHRNWHSLLNAFGMAACYSPNGEHGDFNYPLSKNGEKIEAVWKEWLEKDPLHFLPKRISGLKKLNAIYLDVGTKDNYNLQYGSRQISQILKTHQIEHDYIEFDGNHFDIGERRPEVWKWLTLCFRR